MILLHETGFIRVSNPGPGNRKDTGVTRSPSIRDLVNPEGELNGGMFHLGQTDSLGGMVGFYDFRQPQEANDNLDPPICREVCRNGWTSRRRSATS